MTAMGTAPSAPLGRRAAADVLVQVVARVANLLLGVVATAVIARMLGESGFGQWSTILIIYPIVALLTDLGLSTATVREAAADPEREGEWISALLVVQAALLAPALVAAVAIVFAVHESRQMLVAGLILLALMPFSLSGAIGTVFRIRMRNTVPMIVLTINSVAWTVAVVAIDSAGGSMVALALGATIVNACTALIQITAALRLVRLQRPSREAVRRLLQVGVPVAIGTALVFAYGRIDQLLVFTLSGSRDAGLYGAAYRMLDAWAFVPGSLLITLAPLLAASWPGGEARLRRVTRVAAEYLLMGSLGILAFVLVAADPLVDLVYGSDFSKAAPALMVLAGAFVVISVGYLTDNLLIVFGLQRQLLFIALGGLVVNLAANLVLIPRYGYMGAAWATLGTEVFVEALAIRLVLRVLAIRRPHPGRTVRIALAATALGLLLALLREAGAPLAAIALAAIVGYPALLLVLRAVHRDELTTLVLRRQPAV